MLLAGTANALTASSSDEAMAGAADYADVAEFTRYWAVCAVVVQLDAFPTATGRRLLPLRRPGDQRLFVLPWGRTDLLLEQS